mmetsp:Transcript_13163/g.19158  ORF Transcript_13163/g.19158 Transcript_13163/m.19158 type:complete len:159 (+) Transcript_13163:138-614(+)
MKLLLLFYIACFTFFFGNTEGFSVPRSGETNRCAVGGSAGFRSPVTFFPTTSHTSISGTTLFGKKEARAQGNERKNKTERVRKVKDDVIEVEATVIDSLPNAMFRCSIDGAPETQPPILATISGKIRKNFVKILVGDKVTIELSPYDLTRGRITFRKR